MRHRGAQEDDRWSSTTGPSAWQRTPARQVVMVSWFCAARVPELWVMRHRSIKTAKQEAGCNDFRTERNNMSTVPVPPAASNKKIAEQSKQAVVRKLRWCIGSWLQTDKHKDRWNSTTGRPSAWQRTTARQGVVMMSQFCAARVPELWVMQHRNAQDDNRNCTIAETAPLMRLQSSELLQDKEWVRSWFRAVRVPELWIQRWPTLAKKEDKRRKLPTKQVVTIENWGYNGEAGTSSIDKVVLWLTMRNGFYYESHLTACIQDERLYFWLPLFIREYSTVKSCKKMICINKNTDLVPGAISLSDVCSVLSDTQYPGYE